MGYCPNPCLGVLPPRVPVNHTMFSAAGERPAMFSMTRLSLSRPKSNIDVIDELSPIRPGREAGIEITRDIGFQIDLLYK